jgi:thioesterase domain-containing protein/acyl carrier protein
MVPEHIIDLATFPVGTTGKVDRKNLPDPDDENTRDGTTEKTEPETPTEKQLAEIWEKVLNQKGISREDNFFHLGGTSIKALQVFSSIVREMSLDIPLSTLLTHPTLAGLASALDRASGVDNKEAALQDFPARKGWDSLVPMGGAGRKHPIICVHAVGGNVLSYRSTLETIAKNRPRVGFQSIGLDGHGEPKPTLHEQASDYVRELLEAGYEGPFTIMGGSMGGTIALEMASILTAQSHEVDWVVLLDTIGPAGRVVGVGEDEKAPNMAERVVQGLSGRFTYYAKSGVIALYRRLGAAIPYKLRPFFIQERNKQALSRHEEQPYSGNVFLIRGPENSGGIYSDPKLGWEGILSGTLRIELADVSHDEFMESPLVIERLENFFNGSAGAENGEV